MAAVSDIQKFFEPGWFKTEYDFQIKGFPLDEYFDTSEFINELAENLAAGYDESKPVILAKSRDPDIKGSVCDGRHRLYVGNLLLKRIGKLPNFAFKWVDVADMDTLKALRAEFERKNRSKDSRISKKWMEKNLSDIAESNLDSQRGKLPSYIMSKGFHNRKIIDRIIRDVEEQRVIRKHERKVYDPAANQAKVDAAVAKSREKWGISNGGDFEYNRVSGKQDEQYAADNPDLMTTYNHSCPDCKVPLKIVTDRIGNVIDVSRGLKVQQK